MINTLIILNLVNFNPQYHSMRGRKSVLYIIKKHFGYPSILKRSVMSQETDSKIDLFNILTKRPLNTLQILKK